MLKLSQHTLYQYFFNIYFFKLKLIYYKLDKHKEINHSCMGDYSHRLHTSFNCIFYRRFKKLLSGEFSSLKWLCGFDFSLQIICRWIRACRHRDPLNLRTLFLPRASAGLEAMTGKNKTLCTLREMFHSLSLNCDNSKSTNASFDTTCCFFPFVCLSASVSQ